MIFAFASITLTISSADASLIRFALLNSQQAFFVFSQSLLSRLRPEATCRLLRLSRWKSNMANLCTSSCLSVSADGKGEFCFSPMVCGGKPYGRIAVPMCGVSRLWQVRQWGCQGSVRRQPLLRRSFALFRRR